MIKNTASSINRLDTSSNIASPVKAALYNCRRKPSLILNYTFQIYACPDDQDYQDDHNQSINHIFQYHFIAQLSYYQNKRRLSW